jgi:hypothetical protein
MRSISTTKTTAPVMRSWVGFIGAEAGDIGAHATAVAWLLA